MKPLRIGLLGTARINSKIIPLLNDHKFIKIVAIGSRTLAKAIDFAREHKIAQAFESYESVINGDCVDAVYISLPNSDHFEWSKKALNAGKHVLCEKPLALCSEHVRELDQLAKAKSLVLMEGFMYRHHRQTQTIKTIVDGGRIGAVQSARCSFHFTLNDDQNIRMNPGLGGGALNDIGCYAINMLNFIFNAKPTRILTSVKNVNQVDARFHGMLDYGLGQSAYFDCSFESIRRDMLEIVGSKGVLVVDHPFKPDKIELLHLISASGIESLRVVDPINLYVSQFENFYRAVFHDETTVVTLADSLATAETMEMLRNT